MTDKATHVIKDAHNKLGTVAEILDHMTRKGEDKVGIETVKALLVPARKALEEALVESIVEPIGIEEEVTESE